MQKIKVLHLELDENMGGIESFLYNLYEQIDRKKIQFDFITRADNPAKGNELKKLGANIYKVSSLLHPFSYMRDLENIIKNGNYNIVHIHKNSCANILPFFVTNKFKDLKVYVHSHNTQPSKGNISKVLHFINREFVWKSCDEHFACSEVAGKWLYGEEKEFIVLKNGIITDNYLFNENERNLKREELGITKDTFVIGNVGRFTEQKNQKRLIDIFYQIQKKEKNTALILIGDGELKDMNVIYSKKKGLKNIYFLGVRNDISSLMMAMDVFVMPSLYEGLPIVGVEAQASGLNLYLSNTISRETELLNSVTWFDLNEKDQDIVKKIRIETVSSEERLLRNYDIKKQGYDIEQTAKKLLERYEDC